MSTHQPVVTVVQHLAFENLGSFEAPLKELGFEIQNVQAGVDDVAAAISEAELLVVLGGPIGVYETERYPFLHDELSALQTRLQAHRPTMGICLGAQLIAKALGAAVYPGGRKEIGWDALQLSAAGLRSPLEHLTGVPVLHWHGDTFDLPPEAELLASTSVYPNQAFRLGCNVLALQFHPEALTRTFECWLIGHTGELDAAGLDVPRLRQAAQQHGPRLEKAGQAMLRQWVSDLVWA